MKVEKVSASQKDRLIEKLGIDNETADRLAVWLWENNEVVKFEETYDAQSGWHGEHVFIGEADLSSNGFCYEPKRVSQFLHGEYKLCWYYHWSDTYKDLKEKGFPWR